LVASPCERSSAEMRVICVGAGDLFAGQPQSTEFGEHDSGTAAKTGDGPLGMIVKPLLGMLIAKAGAPPVSLPINCGSGENRRRQLELDEARALEPRERAKFYVWDYWSEMNSFGRKINGRSRQTDRATMHGKDLKWVLR